MTPLFNRKHVSALVLLMLTFSVAFVLPVHMVSAEDEVVVKTFEWNYDGQHWTWNLSIPTSLYNYYKAVPILERVQAGLKGYGFLTTTNDAYIKALALKLNQTATELGYDSYDTVSFVLAFVQSLPYTSDSVTSGFDEYPRFPVETLVDGGGDCEDTAILFATITLILNYGTVYLNPPNHCAVGVLGKDLYGYYLTYNNQTYYYCETTGDGFEIGEMPEEYQNVKMKIYEINTAYQFNPFSDFLMPTPTPAETSPPTPEPTLSPEPTPAEELPPTPTTTLKPTVNPTSSPPPYSGSLAVDFNSTIIIAALIIILLGVIIAAFTQRPKTPPEPAVTLPNQQNIYPPDGFYCIYCGEKNPPEAVFCRRCGKKIS
jgi:hypothetical protein